MQLRLAQSSELMANFSPFLECNAGVSYRQDVLKASEGRTTLGWRMLADTRDSKRSLEKPAPLPRLDSTLMATCLPHHSPASTKMMFHSSLFGSRPCHKGARMAGRLRSEHKLETD